MMNRKNRIVTAFRPHSEGLSKLFGSLESDIMDLVWQHEEATARDIFEALRDQGQRLSYGAVKTVLDRLVQKDVLQRTMENNQYLYRAPLSREEFTKSAVREIISSLVDSFGAPVYAQFLDQIQDSDPDQIVRLTEMINAADRKKKQNS
ncbi:BlaI/MecI/CopY family transcriptional regulator [Oscillochloris sp. ZM17-4]|uniref:BlaI/MecI/CopY family transcriptional regulator n=1 Tax=Oscillochloris sp. ZM17-4 TaxID=2866714 RepID=UPI001C731C2F|nr:BlaI/MecI/CopY family transcriptional regulator [Oscillochloris sp. ZM17-4]MBX0329239.1 BlaI/MecI/CopY family transcriptional regulator [Oscillochloris sp. ZM17-4]